jgi:hypothetical protein
MHNSKKRRQQHSALWRELLLNREGGFSLAEVMVAAGILGVLSLAVTNMTQNITRSQNTMEQRFELRSIIDEVEFMMRSREACEANLQGIALNTVDGSAPGTALGQVDVIERVLGPIRNTVLTRGDVVGGSSAGSRFTVEDMRVAGWYPGSASTLGTANLGTNFSTYTTVDDADNTVTRRTGLARLIIVLKRGEYDGANDADIEAMQQRMAYGPVTTTRYININVVTNEANVIVGCHSGDFQIVQAACAMLGGRYIEGQGRCAEIRPNQYPAAASPETKRHNYAIQTVGGVQVTGGGMFIGGPLGTTAANPAPDTVPPAGRLMVTENSMLRGNTILSSAAADEAGAGASHKLNVHGTSQLLGNVGVNEAADGARALSVVGTSRFMGNMGINEINHASRALSVTGTSRFAGNMGLGTEPDGTHALRITGNSSSDGVLALGGPAIANSRLVARSTNAAAPFLATHIATNTNILLAGVADANNGVTAANERIIINDQGTIRIRAAGSDRVIIGQGSGNVYRPILVADQPGSAALPAAGAARNTFISGMLGVPRDHLATVGFVRNMVFGELSNNTTLMSNVIGAITEYAQHNTLDSIYSSVCTRMRVTEVGNNTLQTCTWTGSQCQCSTARCTSANRCNTLFSNGLDVQGNATVSGTTTTTTLSVTGNATVQGQLNVNSLARMNAGLQVTGNAAVSGNVTAANVTASNTITGNSWVCSGSGCATRFGRQHCPFGGVVVGYYRGYISCAAQGLDGGGVPQATSILAN